MKFTYWRERDIETETWRKEGQEFSSLCRCFLWLRLGRGRKLGAKDPIQFSLVRGSAELPEPPRLPGPHQPKLETRGRAKRQDQDLRWRTQTSQLLRQVPELPWRNTKQLIFEDTYFIFSWFHLTWPCFLSME